MEKQHGRLLVLLIGFIAAMFITGLIVDSPGEALRGFWELQLSPGRLIQDFMQVSGIGAALVNAALAGAVGLVIILLHKVKLSGPTFAAIFTIVGFGLFGKTPFNIIPIMAGVFLAAKFAGKSTNEYLIIALFGTALGPIVSFILFEIGINGWIAIPLGIIAGVGTGFILPSLAVSMLNLHQGYNLYNMGLTCGFFALFAASLAKSSGHQFAGSFEWYNGGSLLLVLLVPVLSLILIIYGTILSGTVKTWIRNLKLVFMESGRLPSDFMELASFSGALINSGLLGLIFSAYLIIIGADFNGPVIGGLLTVMGFGAFGTHLKNSWPVALGVACSTLVFGRGLAEPGPVLAILFGTTLAPLAGQFGMITGFIAGFIHLFMVLQTGAWQGGINLYNNGFTGGITAALIIAVIQWLRSNKKDF